MMKKTIGILLIAVLVYVGCLVGSILLTDNASASNVGDGKEYQFEITDISEREINGEPLNDHDNKTNGILLFEEEVSFEVELGDVVAVVWGEEEDEFASIRLVSKND